MPLTKPNQDLRRELNNVAFSLEQAASEVLSLTKACQGAEVVTALKLISKLYEDADRLAALADEVKAGRVLRTAE
ncbi:hypothetical protein DOZ80_15450 [Pseudomonas fluorescens]|uniref:Peptidase n=1 Tax=Pseudomonas fluorescens TaxID=294 RepID=A0A327N2K5_PSEFL|nr:hypothetical protein [Pseudomonas fluorescens]RAI69527.1 hypothetical protein DOZ80_15450 [Pseudomonas fluorescens]